MASMIDVAPKAENAIKNDEENNTSNQIED